MNEKAMDEKIIKDEAYAICRLLEKHGVNHGDAVPICGVVMATCFAYFCKNNALSAKDRDEGISLMIESIVSSIHNALELLNEHSSNDQRTH